MKKFLGVLAVVLTVGMVSPSVGKAATSFIIDNDMLAGDQDQSLVRDEMYFSQQGFWSPGTDTGWHNAYNNDWLDTTNPNFYRWARWDLPIDTAGIYEVFVKATRGSNMDTDAPFTVFHSTGSDTKTISQWSGDYKGGIPEWHSLGIFQFDLSDPTFGNRHVLLTNQNTEFNSSNPSENTYVIADAVKCTRVPIGSSALLLGSAVVGLVVARRKRTP